MNINSRIKSLTPAILSLLAFALSQAARAELLVTIDKSTQRMFVTVDGEQLYDWPISTGAGRYDTPNGAFKPFRMDIDHRSAEWDNAPMPYSIFFTKTGNAVHGTYERHNLGRPVSHGCVRLSVKNAATLWKLVKRERMANTTVVVGGKARRATRPAEFEYRHKSRVATVPGTGPISPLPIFLFGNF